MRWIYIHLTYFCSLDNLGMNEQQNWDDDGFQVFYRNPFHLQKLP